jgi:hypothetical protein
MSMRVICFIAFLSATFSFHNAYADTRCEADDVSRRVLGFCRTPLFRTYVATTAVGSPSEVGQVIDLLVPRPDNPQIKRACMLQIDGSNVPCDTVWYISFKDGAQSIQFNKGSGQTPIFSFFGKHRDVDIISIDGIAIKVGEQSAQAKASGECILSKTKNAMGCQARIDDGRLVVGTIFVDTR